MLVAKIDTTFAPMKCIDILKISIFSKLFLATRYLAKCPEAKFDRPDNNNNSYLPGLLTEGVNIDSLTHTHDKLSQRALWQVTVAYHCVQYLKAELFKK